MSSSILPGDTPFGIPDSNGDKSAPQKTADNLSTNFRLQYPENLGTDGTHYAVSFDIIRRTSLVSFMKTSESAGEGTAGATAHGAPSSLYEDVKNSKGHRHGKTIGSIYLYMPHEVNTTYATTYQAEADPLSRGLAGSGDKTLIDMIKSYGSEAAASAGRGATASGVSIMPGATQEQAENALMKMGNIAVNPYMEQYFTGVEFRTFNYTFKFTPRSEAETQATVEIIRKFKKHSLPRLEENYLQRFWLYPDEFQISYLNLKSNAPNPFLHKIDACICTSVSVNYTGGGIWAAFRNGAPVEVDLNLAFTETTLMHQDKVDEEHNY